MTGKKKGLSLPKYSKILWTGWTGWTGTGWVLKRFLTRLFLFFFFQKNSSLMPKSGTCLPFFEKKKSKKNPI